MQELTVQTKQIIDTQGTPLSFTYILLESRTKDGDADYGIGIDSSRGESIRLPYLSPDRAAVEGLLELAARLTLSPVHLPDVAEDWLGQ